MPNAENRPWPWAKLQRHCKEGRGDRCRAGCDCPVTGALSLIGHSADVAALMHALLGQPTIARRLARLLEQTALTPRDRAQLTALAALHDLGKINHGFQRKPFVRGARGGHIGPLVDLLHESKAEFRALRDDGVLRRWQHLLEHEAGDLTAFDAILAHHGSLPKAGPGNGALWRKDDIHDPVRACRDLVESIAAWLPEALASAPLNWNAAFQHAFAGLLMLADWLGSDSAHFPMAGEGAPDGPARFAWAAPIADSLLRARAIAPERARAAATALRWDGALLTGFVTPSAAQAAMLTLAPPGTSGRTCLIEDETGSGKTEAALIHFLDLFRAGEVDGMYFALPTRAAARQIHGRIREALLRLLGDATPHVTLAVPDYLCRALDDAATDNAALPDEAALFADAGSGRDARWASERPKRYLASWVAVGTIDQVLMGGLRVRHAQLRSSAMLRLLLVVDEVHASDTYMTAILRNVLDQHRRAGGHALLMSATLGSEARGRLLQPRGRVDTEPYEGALDTPYPAVWTDAAAAPLRHISSKCPQKLVRAELAPEWRDPGIVAAGAAAAARQGARVLVIRNTVRDTVATQQALEALAPGLSLQVATPGGTVCCPHHAKYAPEDRSRLDAALERALGKQAITGAGCVTIASQTAEQSLDIDADLLLSDLCPADVLLQRIGRLHRHRRDRPAGFAEATVVVLAPSELELAASVGADGVVRAGPLALGLVYPDLLGIIATRRRLEAAVLSIPRDNRALVEDATHPERLRALAETLGGAFPAHWTAVIGLKGAHAMAARGACLNWCEPVAPFPDLAGAIATRLGLKDRTVELPDNPSGPFGGAISMLSVPGRWLGGVAQEEEPVVALPAAGTLSVALGERRFVYDRLGLRPE